MIEGVGEAGRGSGGGDVRGARANGPKAGGYGAGREKRQTTDGRRQATGDGRWACSCGQRVAGVRR